MLKLENNRLVKIIRQLPGGWKKVCSEELAKYKSLGKLFEYIDSHKAGELDKESILLRVYKRPYTKSNDALLRVDLNRLAEIVEGICARQVIEEDKEGDKRVHYIGLLKLYLRLELLEEYKEVMTEANAWAMKNGEYDFYIKNLSDYVELTMKVVSKYEQRAEIISAVHKEFRELITKDRRYKFFLYKLIYETETWIKAEMGMDNASFDTSPFFEAIDEPVSDNEQLLQHYMNCIRALAKPDSLQVFERAIDFLETLDYSQPSMNDYRVSGIFLLAAVQYSINGLYDESEEIYRSFIDKPHLNNGKYMLSNQFNRITNLIKGNRPEAALQLIVGLEDKTKYSPYFAWQFKMRKLMLLLSLGRTDELIRAVLLSEHEDDADPTLRAYERLSLCDAYILDGDYATAQTEINNVLRSKLFNVAQSDFLPIAKVMDYLIDCMCKNGKAKLTKPQIDKLNQMPDYIAVESSPGTQTYFPYAWLKTHLGLQ